ncbi:MAG: ABC transporter ATP-binding protein, partial [Acidobacteriota bacterium]
MSARGATHRLLEASSLAVRLGGRDVLSEVNLRVAAGEVVAVAGPNGAGKTTLLRALAGGVRPWRGLVRLQGELVEKMPRPRLARQLAYLPQETWTVFGLLVEDVVRLGLFPHVGMLRTLRAEDYRAVRDAMDQADVAHLARRPVTEL